MNDPTKVPLRRFARISMFIALAGAATARAQQEGSVPGEPISAAKQFVGQLTKGEFSPARARFDATMKRVVSEAKLAEIWASLISQTGPLREQVGARTEKVGQYDVVFVTCKFERSTLDVKVVFNRDRQIGGLFFVPSRSAADDKPPDYAKPDSFREEEVVVGSGEWELPATVTLPAGEGLFPAVVLVHGSGPNDRDETIGPNKPFRDLALGLATRGVGVLRYDKRTKVYGPKLAAAAGKITVKEEAIDDALAAVALLRETPGIDPKRIFVAGHSLGGMLIPRIAARDQRIAGFVVLAGTTRPLEDVVLDQHNYLFSLDGETSATEKEILDKLQQQVARVKDPALSAETPGADLPLGIPAAYWLDLRGYDPAKAAKRIRRPLLILQGQRDYQVTAEDFAGWRESLSSRANVRLKQYPTLNHLFMHGEGAGTPAEYLKAGHVAEIVVEDIARWIETL